MGNTHDVLTKSFRATGAHVTRPPVVYPSRAGPVPWQMRLDRRPRLSR